MTPIYWIYWIIIVRPRKRTQDRMDEIPTVERKEWKLPIHQCNKERTHQFNRCHQNVDCVFAIPKSSSFLAYFAIENCLTSHIILPNLRPRINNSQSA